MAAACRGGAWEPQIETSWTGERGTQKGVSPRHPSSCLSFAAGSPDKTRLAQVLYAVVELLGPIGIQQQVVLAEERDIVAVPAERPTGLPLVQDQVIGPRFCWP